MTFDELVEEHNIHNLDELATVVLNGGDRLVDLQLSGLVTSGHELSAFKSDLTYTVYGNFESI